jgi:hypothetical protein
MSPLNWHYARAAENKTGVGILLLISGFVLLAFTLFIFCCARITSSPAPYPDLLSTHGATWKIVLLIVGTVGFLCSTFDSLIFAATSRFVVLPSQPDQTDVARWDKSVFWAICASLVVSFALMSARPVIYTSLIGLTGSFICFLPLLVRVARSKHSTPVTKRAATELGILFFATLVVNFSLSLIGHGDWIPGIILCSLLAGCRVTAKQKLSNVSLSE